MNTNESRPTTAGVVHPATLSDLRRSSLAVAFAFVASAGLVLLGLDGLMFGHVHIEDGEVEHHRHLYEGAHTHEDPDEHSGEHDDSIAHADGDLEDHAETPAHSDDEAPEKQRGSTISTLEIATSLETTPVALSSFGLSLTEETLAGERHVDLASRQTLAEAARPPPTS